MAARALSVDGTIQRGNGVVVAVARSGTHSFSKRPCDAICLVAGLGVEGDAHLGSTVKHRSRVRRDPTMPNLRQVHLIHAELFEELRRQGFAISPGDIGENVTTRGIDLLALPAGAHLRLGAAALIKITGLRNPCVQLDRFTPGLMAATLDQDADGNVIRRAGVMAIVLRDGEVRSGDVIERYAASPTSPACACIAPGAWCAAAAVMPNGPADQ